MLHKKLISIVLPTYNGSRFLRDSIESVVSQTYEHWELIIVNDCSTDNTLKIAKEYEERDSRIRVISNNINKKLPASLNIGFRYAKGDYYTWTSDDNIFKKNAIEYMSHYLDTHPEIDLISCNFDFVDEDLRFIRTMKEACGNEKREQIQLALHCQVGACFMYTKAIAKKVGDYDTSFFCAEDYDYWCRIAKDGKIAYVDENLYIYRMNSMSLTSTKIDEVLLKTREIRLKHSSDILKKLNVDNRAKCKMYLNCYQYDQNNEKWLSLAKNADPFYYLLRMIRRSMTKIGESIFSIKRENDQKIMRLFGIKLLTLHRKKT
ncbi:glycosyltransferase [Oxalobacter formigenes]|uniref:glycosyltransferase family 2 protein n=1 Tax=Oxalobacter formigenes TaxID=847 RepID=UPI0022AFD070|nr:glycosyltransferase [Oxalobacter formigenes]WAW06844.1 glycosyltransferase [Oxalobacter formigenes]